MRGAERGGVAVVVPVVEPGLRAFLPLHQREWVAEVGAGGAGTFLGPGPVDGPACDELGEALVEPAARDVVGVDPRVGELVVEQDGVELLAQHDLVMGVVEPGVAGHRRRDVLADLLQAARPFVADQLAQCRNAHADLGGDVLRPGVVAGKLWIATVSSPMGTSRSLTREGSRAET